VSEHGRVVDVPIHQRYNYPPGWVPDRVNAEYLRRLLGLAQAHGITVYWLIPPVHPGVQAAKEAAGFDARYLAFVRSCQARYSNLVVIDGSRSGYDPSTFVDPDHLGLEGAYALSTDLGNVLCRARVAPVANRWVSLPAYRARVLPPGVEPVTGARADAVVRR
jgi:hypothetical protein